MKARASPPMAHLGGQYKLVVKVAEKRWFNGTRLSPHIFNTERLPVRLALAKSLWCR